MKKIALSLAALVVAANVSAETVNCPAGPIHYNPQTTQMHANAVWWGIWGTPGNTPNTFYLAGALGNKKLISSGTCVYSLNGQMPSGTQPTLLLSSDYPLAPSAGNWTFDGDQGTCKTDQQNCQFKSV